MLKLFFFINRWEWKPTFATVRASRVPYSIPKRIMLRSLLLFVSLWAATVLATAQQAALPVAFVSNDRTANAGKVAWQFYAHDFGKMHIGDTVSVNFTLKNISEEELHLLQVSPTCYCTTPYWDKSPVASGETRTIRIEFIAEKPGDFYKVVLVKTNFDSEQPLPLSVKGKVLPKE